MKTRTVVLILILVFAVLIIVGSCATGRKIVSGAEWDYVALGDSRTEMTSYSEYYATYIKADLGVEVNLQNKAAGGLWTSDQLSYIQDNESLRELISEAEVITIFTMDNLLFSVLNTIIPCDDKAVEDFEKNLDQIIAEIYSLRGHRKTIIRLIEQYHFNIKFHQEFNIFETKKMCVNTYNDRLHRVAAKYNIPVVPLYLAFNGPNGDEDPDAKGYFKDGVHTNGTGDVIIADLLQELGYEPLAP